ncbi:MAG: glucokinase [Candidatus Methylomirabilia bacterium]
MSVRGSRREAAGAAGTRILAADIGGTNSRFGLFETEGAGELSLRATRWLPTREARSFGHLLDMLRGADFPIAPEAADIVVVAIAGPVLGGVRSAPPFISWAVDFSHASEQFGFRRSLLINDFAAQAFATRTRAATGARPILKGHPVEAAAVGVIGAGTGLGQATLLPDGNGGYLAVASEGGHAEFPLVGREESALGESLRGELGVARLTSTMVVSGAGLSNIHRHLTGRRLPPARVAAELTPDSPTLAWAARFYGRVCKLFALHAAAFGGVFVAGGVAARVPALLTHPAFEEEFRTSVHLADLLREIPVSLMTDQESGLWGAAYLGAQITNKRAAARGVELDRHCPHTDNRPH